VSTTYIPAELRRLVQSRAVDCCEYCRIPQAAAFAVHQVDHVIAEKHGGETVAENLALSCVLCNRHKGSDLASLDPETGALTPLFHPRHDRWADHFRLASGIIEAQTSVGRATARLLQLNHPDRVAERVILVAVGAMTPPTDGS
jgi:5-methylcytosine-specific restriction endonuclease McrA